MQDMNKSLTLKYYSLKVIIMWFIVLILVIVIVTTLIKANTLLKISAHNNSKDNSNEMSIDIDICLSVDSFYWLREANFSVVLLYTSVT